MVIEVLEQGIGLLFRPTMNFNGEIRVHIKSLFACAWVCEHHGVDGFTAFEIGNLERLDPTTVRDEFRWPSISFMPSESASYALDMDEKRVSPPLEGTSLA